MCSALRDSFRHRLPGPRWLAILCGLSLGTGCIVEAPGSSRGGPRGSSTGGTVPSAPPAPAAQLQTFQVGANLGGKVEIAATRIEPGRAQPGDTVKVTAFLRVLDTPDVDYMVFVHVEDADGKAERMNVDHPPPGGGRTTQWRQGETLRDEFNVYVPPVGGVRRLNIYYGFWDPKTDERLPLSNPAAVRHDGSHRILVAQIPVG